MTVDFENGRATGFAAITVDWTGPWNERRIRKEWEALAAWAKERSLRTGRWVFSGRSERKWRVGIEVRGKVRGSGRFHVRKFPPASVVRITFDPEVVSPSVVYHGLNDHLRWRRKSKEIRSVGEYREVYDANPWTNAKAGARCRIEAVVRK